MLFSELLSEIGKLIRQYLNPIEETQQKQEDVSRGNTMCGSLSHSVWNTKAPITVGSSFPDNAVISIDGKETSSPSIWNGFIRIEALDKWKKGGWKEGILHANSFTEKNQPFSIPAGKGIRVAVLEKPTARFVGVITRESTAEEAKVHERWPEFADLPKKDVS